MSSDALMVSDLLKSGLSPSDVNARPIETPERAITNTPHSVEGYVLPYFDLNGKILPHYRVRLFDHDPKYKQPKETPNYVYFPPTFKAVSATRNYVLVTEGEKK